MKISLHMKLLPISLCFLLMSTVTFAQIKGVADLSSAIVQWVRDSPADELNHQLESSLARDEVYGHSATLTWRPETLTDYRGQRVMRSEERLIRWDRREPNDIFQNGFIPQRPDSWDDSEGNLASYVRVNSPSMFVSASRYVNRNGRPYYWQPRDRTNQWQYEIFAPGGLDVNLSLGPDHQYANQNEIAFPGGVRPEFIRLARQYDSSGNLVRIIANPNFNPEARHAGNIGDRDLADERLLYIPSPTCGSRTTWVPWDGTNGRSSPSDISRKPRSTETANFDDTMRADGDLFLDDEAVAGNTCAGTEASTFKVLPGSIKIDSSSTADNFNTSIYGTLALSYKGVNVDNQIVFVYLDANPFPLVINSGKWATPSFNGTTVPPLVHFTAEHIAQICLNAITDIYASGFTGGVIIPSGTSTCSSTIDIEDGGLDRYAFELKSKNGLNLQYSVDVVGI